MGRVSAPAARTAPSTASTAAGGVAAAATLLGLSRRHLAGLALKLPPPRYRVRAERGLRVPMRDGVRLATDVLHPVRRRPRPAILLRTPYGRRGLSGAPTQAMARLFAERGYSVVVQDVRGKFDSEGRFVPPVHEGPDGADTAQWAVDQPWCDGRVGAIGPSYVGATSWAVADSSPHVRAIVPVITSTRLGLPDAQEVRHLDLIARWLSSMAAMDAVEETWWRRLHLLSEARRAEAGLTSKLEHLPVRELDEVFLGEPSEVWKLWVEHPRADDPFWTPAVHTAARERVPALHVTGWWDIFLDEQLEDAAAAPRGLSRLIVGPWSHLDPRAQVVAIRRGLGWLDHHLKGRPLPPLDPVRLWIGGADVWRSFDGWPVPSTPSSWWLARDGALVRSADAAEDGSTTFRYDPADPTPSLGGRLLSLAAGRVDDAPLEERDDVRTWTSPPLEHALEVVGAPVARVAAAASRPTFDVFVRLCDVDPAGRSWSVTDGITRTSGGDGPVEVRLSNTGHRFGRGHRLRVVVAGGAFPRYDRNLGVPNLDGGAVELRATEIAVRVGGATSCLELPVVR